MLTSIIINPIVLAHSPCHSSLNLANCKGIEALISIWGLLNENDFQNDGIPRPVTDMALFHEQLNMNPASHHRTEKFSTVY